MSDETPKVGDVLKRNGDTWIVESVTEAVDWKTQVTLRPGPVLSEHEEAGKERP